MVEAALVLCVNSEEVVTAMLFTVTLVEANAGSGGAKTEHWDVITSAVVVGPVDAGNRVQDVSPSPQEGPQEELMSVRSVMAKETCAVKGKKNVLWATWLQKVPLGLKAEPESQRPGRGVMNYWKVTWLRCTAMRALQRGFDPVNEI